MHWPPGGRAFPTAEVPLIWPIEGYQTLGSQLAGECSCGDVSPSRLCNSTSEQQQAQRDWNEWEQHGAHPGLMFLSSYLQLHALQCIPRGPKLQEVTGQGPHRYTNPCSGPLVKLIGNEGIMQSVLCFKSMCFFLANNNNNKGQNLIRNRPKETL